MDTDHAANLREMAASNSVLYDRDRAKLRAAADEIERLTLVWTTERPTVNDKGYWREQANGERYPMVVNESLIRYLGIGPDDGGRWAGPIPEPREPQA